MACTNPFKVKFGKTSFGYFVPNLDIVNWEICVACGAKTLPSPLYMPVFDHFKVLRLMI